MAKNTAKFTVIEKDKPNMYFFYVKVNDQLITVSANFYSIAEVSNGSILELYIFDHEGESEMVASFKDWGFIKRGEIV